MCTFDYPEHYNYLTKDQQESVLSWFNTTKDIERSIISNSVKSKSERELKAFSENRERYETRLRGAQSILRSMGVFVEYVKIVGIIPHIDGQTTRRTAVDFQRQ